MNVVRSFAVLVIAVFWTAAAFAWEKGPVSTSGGQKCTMQETGQVGISFNNVMVAKLDRLGAEMDQKIDEVLALAKQARLEKIEVQSYSYNVYPVSNGSLPGANVPYQYSGNVSFSVEPCAKASELMSLLAAKGYSANMNVNAYRQCQ
jgi:uncharacterized protein YggE